MAPFVTLIQATLFALFGAPISIREVNSLREYGTGMLEVLANL